VINKEIEKDIEINSQFEENNSQFVLRLREKEIELDMLLHSENDSMKSSDSDQGQTYKSDVHDEGIQIQTPAKGLYANLLSQSLTQTSFQNQWFQS